MKVALAQLNFHVGNFEANSSKIIECINRAKNQNADVVVFPELAVCAYPPLDFLEFEDFIKRCHTAIDEIATVCTGITAIVGCPSRNPVLEGKNLYNSAFVLADGSVKQVVNKTLLPTYDVFDEYRYFEPNRNFNCIEVAGEKVALTICEDLWNGEDDPLYIHSPMKELQKEKPVLIINIAASPFDYKHAEQRKAILKRNVLQYGVPLVYVNHVGAQTEIIFDGGSVVWNADGGLAHECNYFEEDFVVIDTVDLNKKTISEKPVTHDKTEWIYEALIMGIKE